MPLGAKAARAEAGGFRHPGEKRGEARRADPRASGQRAGAGTPWPPPDAESELPREARPWVPSPLLPQPEPCNPLSSLRASSPGARGRANDTRRSAPGAAIPRDAAAAAAAPRRSGVAAHPPSLPRTALRGSAPGPRRRHRPVQPRQTPRRLEGRRGPPVPPFCRRRHRRLGWRSATRAVGVSHSAPAAAAAAQGRGVSWIHPVRAGDGGGERAGRGRAPSRRGGAALVHQPSALARAPSVAAGGGLPGARFRQRLLCQAEPNCPRGPAAAARAHSCSPSASSPPEGGAAAGQTRGRGRIGGTHRWGLRGSPATGSPRPALHGEIRCGGRRFQRPAPYL